MMKKYWLIFVAMVFLSVSMFGATDVQSKTIELRFNYSMPAKKGPGGGWEWFGEELAKRSGGRVKVTYFPHGALFKIRAAIENIMAGTADITNISVRTFAKRFPLISVTLLPTITWPDDLAGTTASSRAIMKIIDEFPGLQKELKDFKILWITQLTAYNLISKKPIHTPSDLKGLKIGAGGIQGQFITQQGGSGIAIVPPKSYLSLKTGVVDGMIMSWNAMGIYKLWEIAKHVTEVTMGRVPLPIVMNNDSWNSLSPDLQKMMMEVGDESLKVSISDMYKGTVRGRKKMIAGGTKVFTPTPQQEAVWTDAFAPLESQWLAARKKQGFSEAPALLKRYKELAAAAYK